MPYYLIIALQAFCIYHLYKNKNEYYWVFLIIFLPVLGSIIYIFSKVYNKRNAEKIQSEITTIINPTKKITDLERKLQFSETFQNKVNLADAYFEVNSFENAIKYYEDAINSGFQNDVYVLKQLIKTYFELGEYHKVIEYVEKIKQKSEFKGSNTQFLYGLTLEKLDRHDEAEKQLRLIDVPNSNFEERVTYAKFLKNRNKTTEAKEVLDELYSESQYMIRNNKRKYRSAILEVEQLLKQF